MPIDRHRNQTLFRRISRLLKQAGNKPQPKTVHHLRTSARRIEALLQALDPEGDKNQRKLLKRVAKVRRRAGKVRDMDVQLGLIRSLDIGRHGQQKQVLADVLVELRNDREKKLISAVDAETVHEIRRRLQKAAKRLSLFEEPSASDGKLDCARIFDPVTTALREFASVARAQGELRESNLHDFRMKTRRVRYIAEMAGEDETAKRIVAEIKRMQAAIGEWHDWLELSQRAQETLHPESESRLLAALQNVTRARYHDALSACTDARKRLLELGQTLLPPAKKPSGVRGGAIAATA